MLDETLHKIAHHGARWPLSFWTDEYDRLKGLALSELPPPFVSLRDVLTAPQPDEGILVKALRETVNLLHQAGQFDATTVGCRKIKADFSAFQRLAQTTRIFEMKRAKKANKFTPDQVKAHDMKLFDGYEGTMYSMEFYLTVYKLIRDAKDEATAREAIEKVEFDTGLGGVPGLWIDFYRMDVIEKFIYLVLDDAVRRELAYPYFTFRAFLLDIRMTPDEPWPKYEIDRVLFAFRSFLQQWLAIYQKNGVQRLRSYLLSPFGDQPLLSDIKL